MIANLKKKIREFVLSGLKDIFRAEWNARIERALDAKIQQAMAKRVDDEGHPNLSPAFKHSQQSSVINHHVKQYGRVIAKEGFEVMSAARAAGYSPGEFGLGSKACTFEDMCSPWYHRWCDELKMAPVLHRKVWEFCYILQVLEENGTLEEGKSALGFGCGQEELPALFAARGMDVVATDLEPEQVAGMGWVESGQHSASIEHLYHEELVSRQSFDRHVKLEFADMNAIPERYAGKFDICWSVCALEHLGSIGKGIDFVVNGSKTLKPGGVLVHTTEFNVWEDEETIDNWGTVLFRRKDFEEMAIRLEESGCKVLPLDFNTGKTLVDQFVDLPPYGGGHESPHLKLSIDGFASTCFGIAAIKR